MPVYSPVIDGLRRGIQSPVGVHDDEIDALLFQDGSGVLLLESGDYLLLE